MGECNVLQRLGDGLIPLARHASKWTNPTGCHDIVCGLKERKVKVVNLLAV